MPPRRRIPRAFGDSPPPSRNPTRTPQASSQATRVQGAHHGGMPPLLPLALRLGGVALPVPRHAQTPAPDRPFACLEQPPRSRLSRRSPGSVDTAGSDPRRLRCSNRWCQRRGSGRGRRWLPRFRSGRSSGRIGDSSEIRARGRIPLWTTSDGGRVVNGPMGGN